MAGENTGTSVGAWSRIKSAVSSAGNFATSLGSKAWEGIKAIGEKFKEWGLKVYDKFHPETLEDDYEAGMNSPDASTDAESINPADYEGVYDISMRSTVGVKEIRDSNGNPSMVQTFIFDNAIANHAKLSMLELYASDGGNVVYPGSTVSEMMGNFNLYTAMLKSTAKATDGIVIDDATGTINWDKSTMTPDDFFDKVGSEYQSRTGFDSSYTDAMKSYYVDAVSDISDFMKHFNDVADYEGDILIKGTDVDKLMNMDPKTAAAVYSTSEVCDNYIKYLQTTYHATALKSVSEEAYYNLSNDGNSGQEQRELPEIDDDSESYDDEYTG